MSVTFFLTFCSLTILKMFFCKKYTQIIFHKIYICRIKHKNISRKEEQLSKFNLSCYMTRIWVVTFFQVLSRNPCKERLFKNNIFQLYMNDKALTSTKLLNLAFWNDWICMTTKRTFYIPSSMIKMMKMGGRIMKETLEKLVHFS